MSAIQNLNNTHISEENDKKINDALAALDDVLKSYLSTSHPKNGSVNEQNKLFIDKVRMFHAGSPELSNPEIGWSEFDLDYTDRARIESYIIRLKRLLNGLNNTKTLHDFDNYRAALDDYAYTKYKRQTTI